MNWHHVSFLMSTRVAKGIIGLSIVFAIGTAGYMAIEGWSFLDAIYMTITTVTTVGFREVGPLSPGAVLMVIGNEAELTTLGARPR